MIYGCPTFVYGTLIILLNASIWFSNSFITKSLTLQLFHYSLYPFSGRFLQSIFKNLSLNQIFYLVYGFQIRYLSIKLLPYYLFLEESVAVVLFCFILD